MHEPYNLYYDTEMEWAYIELDNVRTHYAINEQGVIMNTITGKIKRTSINQTTGYETVNFGFNGKTYTKTVHRLIMESFYPLRLVSENEVNHKDGKKSRNVSSNLEWATPADNQQHAIDMGLAKDQKGINNNYSCHTESQIREACVLEMDGVPRKEIAEKTGIHYGSLSQILRPNGQWSHITCDYDLHPVNRFDNSTRSKIASLIEVGYTPKVICEILDIEWCRPNVESIKSIRKTLKRREAVAHAKIC